MLLIVALLLIVVIVLARRVEDVEDVPVKDVPADVFDVSVEDIAVKDISVADVPVDVSIADVKNVNVTEASEEELEALCQILSPPRSSRRSSKIVEGPEVKRGRPRSQGKKTYVSWSWEEETEAELLASEFDKKFFGRRASKKKSNHEDLRPVGRRPRDNKEKGDFRVDRRLKASRQKAVVESRTA